MHSVPDFKLEHTEVSDKPAFLIKKKKRKKANTQIDKTWEQYWPPKGWPMFEGVFEAKAIATRKLEDLNITQGASYDISIDASDAKDTQYTLEIQEWSYDHSGQHKISTAFRLGFKNCSSPESTGDIRTKCITSLSLYGADKSPATVNETTNYALVAAYIASRIEKNTVPDIKRILKLYKLI
jgi:hypothetical protein